MLRTAAALALACIAAFCNADESSEWPTANTDTFKIDDETCGGYNLGPYFDQTLGLSEDCEDILADQAKEDPDFWRFGEVGRYTYHSHWGFGVEDVTDSWQDAFVTARLRAEGQNPSEAQIRATVVDSRDWSLKESERELLTYASENLMNVRMFLEFGMFEENPELPVFCHEKPFELSPLAAKTGSEQATVLTVAGMSRQIPRSHKRECRRADSVCLCSS